MDKSILLLILAMCLVLGLMLYIYFRKEKNHKDGNPSFINHGFDSSFLVAIGRNN